MLRKYTGVCLIIIGIAARPAFAEQKQGAAESPKVLKDVMDCAQVADPAVRLECYDSGIAKLKAAQQAKQIYVADREQIKKTQKGLFGFALPSIKIFADNDDGDEIQSISGKIIAVREGRRGWVFELEDGAVWAQTDSRFYGRSPKAGQMLEVKKAALGSFMAKVDGGIAFRAERLNKTGD
jgi:hypothetical protein